MSELLRFHLLAPAHTQTTKQFAPCAYTQKVYKMGQMLLDLGHHVIHYGAEGSDLTCSEHVTCVTKAEQDYCYKGYDWRKEQFRHDPKDFAYQSFNKRAIEEINRRGQEKDILLVSMGNYQKPIADALGAGVQVVEMGIGYSGVFAKHRVWESYAWMHHVYGIMSRDGRSTDGHWYDAVIPNYFDPADFEFSAEKEDYYLYMGRLIARKGLHIAAQVVEHLGAKLVVAGQGQLSDVEIDSPNVEHVGTVGFEERSELMRKARAIFAPTIYIEPFGAVAVEAMFCGTPAITTDWGAFTETIDHGVTGYRCRTFDDFVWAAQHVGDLNPETCRQWAMDHYSMDRIAPMYDEYFHKVNDLWREGWYQLHPQRQDLEWLRRRYPGR